MQLNITQRGGQRLGPLLFINGSVDGHTLQKTGEGHAEIAAVCTAYRS
jgi:hypothetical protein